MKLLLPIIFVGLSSLTVSTQVPAHQTGQQNGVDNNPHAPSLAHQHVRQRVGYGQGFRYGHSVNGPQGSITIWSPAPTQSYGAIESVSVMRQPHTPSMRHPNDKNGNNRTSSNGFNIGRKSYGQ
jgi:hypothetical protein